MLDIVGRGTFMGKEFEISKKLMDNMQDNHVQWHVERSTTSKVNSITEEKMKTHNKCRQTYMYNQR